MTSPGCVRSARPPERTADTLREYGWLDLTAGELRADPTPAGQRLCRLGFLMAAGVVLPRGCQQARPGYDLWAPTQQRPPFPLSHSTPHSEFGSVIERVCEALHPHRATTAHRFGTVLCCSLHKQGVRVLLAARGLRDPIVHPRHRVTSVPPPNGGVDGEYRRPTHRWCGYCVRT